VVGVLCSADGQSYGDRFFDFTVTERPDPTPTATASPAPSEMLPNSGDPARTSRTLIAAGLFALATLAFAARHRLNRLDRSEPSQR
jgi:hypothetical protein